MSRREWAFLIAFAILGFGSCYLVVSHKGYGQMGNALSFLGSVAALIPPFNQVRSNRKFTRALEIPAHPDLAELDEDVETQRRLSFMAFKPFDYTLLVGGLVLVSLGFLTSIITATAPQ